LGTVKKAANKMLVNLTLVRSLFYQHFKKSFCEDFLFAKKLQTLLSISSTFYKQLLRQYSFAKRLQSRTVIREKLSKALFLGKSCT